MKTRRHISLLLLLALLTTGCRSRHAVVEARSSARNDSVAVLRSVAIRELATESETTVLVMRPDTTGRLTVVAKDVTRTVTRTAEAVESGDTARFVAESRRDDIRDEKTGESCTGAQQAPRKVRIGFVSFVWGAMAALVTLLALTLYAQWKSKNS